MSRIILGCGNFGGIGSSPSHVGKGTARAEAYRLLDAAWDLGITTLDTADAYGLGSSEEYIGEWLRTRPPEVRDRVVLATKTFNPMAEGDDHGLGAARIRRQVEASLGRLGVERIPPTWPTTSIPTSRRRRRSARSTSSFAAGRLAPSARPTSRPSSSRRRSSFPR